MSLQCRHTDSGYTDPYRIVRASLLRQIGISLAAADGVYRKEGSDKQEAGKRSRAALWK